MEAWIIEHFRLYHTKNYASLRTSFHPIFALWKTNTPTRGLLSSYEEMIIYISSTPAFLPNKDAQTLKTWSDNEGAGLQNADWRTPEQCDRMFWIRRAEFHRDCYKLFHKTRFFSEISICHNATYFNATRILQLVATRQVLPSTKMTNDSGLNAFGAVWFHGIKCIINTYVIKAWGLLCWKDTDANRYWWIYSPKEEYW